jgi:DNA repair protein RadA/Sms
VSFFTLTNPDLSIRIILLNKRSVLSALRYPHTPLVCSPFSTRSKRGTNNERYREFTMAKQKTIFVCQSCGYKAPKWLGRCPDCSAWNSFVEELSETVQKERERRQPALDKPRRIDSISTDKEIRLKTGLNEFDRTLGGGLVPGSLVLIGGDPGIGKSTLILQAVQKLAQYGLKTLYVSGEPPAQSGRYVKLRVDS